MTVELHYRQLGDQGDPLIILHGLFGSSDNWQSLGKLWSEHFRVFFVDERNHGRSEHSIIHTYEAMAEDLDALMNDLDLDDAHILGHSMGGKTAMRFGQMFEERVRSLIIADMGVKSYPPHHEHIIKALNSFNPQKINSRTEAEEYLRKEIKEEGVIQFLLKNLYRQKSSGYAWRFNLPVLEASMPDILDEIPPIEVHKPTLFINGELSNYILDADHEEINQLFPEAKFITINDAGHWLHADKPEDFFEQTTNFLNSVS